MKYTFLFLLLVFSLTIQAQKRCWKENEDIGEFVLCPCDDPDGSPWNYRYMDMDSMLHSLSLEFFTMLNKVRVKNGLNALVYDSTMYNCVTLPHNTWQLEKNEVSHVGSVQYFSNKLSRCGYLRMSECVASRTNGSFDTDKNRSYFLEQYEDSPPHWESLMESDMIYISISTLYSEKHNTFYSTVNMR